MTASTSASSIRCGDALTSASASHVSTPTTLSLHGGSAMRYGEPSATTAAQLAADLLPPSLAAAPLLQDGHSTLPLPQQPQQRRVRQWTPRRRAPPSAGSLVHGTLAEGGSDTGVTTVRDWVRSAGCSPSKEPRSASTSRRDSLASSFASALVPLREGQSWEGALPSTSASDAYDGTDADGNGDACAREGDWERGFRHFSDGVTSGSSISATLARPAEEASPQRTPSWRQLRSHVTTTTNTTAATTASSISSHPAAAAAAAAHPAFTRRESWHGSSVSDGATTLLGGWRARAGDIGSARSAASGHDPSADEESLTGVSSPSFVTPLPSPRAASALSARELAQLGEWRTITAASQREQCSPSGHGLPPTVPTYSGAPPRRATSPDYGTGRSASWRSASLSRASAGTGHSAGLWSGRGGGAVQRVADWASSGALGSLSTSFAGAQSADGADSRASASPSSPAACGSFSDVHVYATRDVPAMRRAHRSAHDSLSSPALSTASLPTSLHDAHDGSRFDCYPGVHHGDDDCTMDDIEVALTKRKCVESPSRSPPSPSSSSAAAAAASLSGSFAASLADALADAPTARVAMPSEAHLWQQRQRRRRAVSPSVARPDDEDAHPTAAPHVRGGEVSGSRSAGDGGSGSGAAAGAAPRGACARTFSPTSPIRTAAPSMVPAHAQPAPPLLPSRSPAAAAALQLSPPRLRVGSSDDSDGGDDRRKVLRRGCDVGGVLGCGVGHVVELDCPRAASLTSSTGSTDNENGDGGDEPEVDTFELERAQAAMEEADAEVAGALQARQHRLYLLATSQFARDVERLGGHVDPLQLAIEEEQAEAEEERMSSGGTSRSRARRGAADCVISGTGSYTSTTAAAAESDASASMHSPDVTSPLPVPPPFTHHPAGPHAERTSCTPPRRAGAHVRWSEPEESEEGQSPGSGMTGGSRSLRDVSPPVRERSLAPAELRREREGRVTPGSS